MQNITEELVSDIDIKALNYNQKLKFLQISLQYLLPRLKHQTNENYEMSSISHQINIVETTDELERFEKVRRYEEENNVKIL